MTVIGWMLRWKQKEAEMKLQRQVIESWTRAQRRRRMAAVLAISGLGAAALLLAGCNPTTPATEATRPQTNSSAQTNAVPPPVTIYLSILTPTQTGKDGYPAYLPSAVTVPANSEVTFVISNFDDATPLTAAQFANVTGTQGGNMTVTPIEEGNPNAAAGATSVVTKLSPDAVSHTFTAPTLGNLNIPLPADSRVTFTIHTGAAGTYNWYCLDPCGTGPDGTGGPMVTPGYMQGTIVVA